MQQSASVMVHQLLPCDKDSLVRTVIRSRSLICRDLDSAPLWPALSFVSLILYQLDRNRTDEGQIGVESAAAL